MSYVKPAPLPLPLSGRPVWMADVVVIGGGPVGGTIGAAAAWQLAQRGAEVVLIDPGTAPAAGGLGSARLHRAAHRDPDDVALADEAFGLWRELEAETGADLLHVTGSVDHGDPSRLAELAAALACHGIAHEWLAAADAAARWPGTAFEGRVLYQPDRSGRLHADQVRAALTAAAVGHGALVQHNTRVEALTVRGPRSQETAQVDVVTGRDVVRARRVVVIADATTSGLLAGVLTLPPRQATSRQVAQFPLRAQAPCGGCPPRWPAVVHHGTDGTTGYGIATGQGLQAGVDGTLDALQAQVRSWFPGADADGPVEVTRIDTCAPDSSFVLETAGPVVVGAGFGPSAFTFVPALGRALAERAVGVPATAAAAAS